MSRIGPHINIIVATKRFTGKKYRLRDQVVKTGVTSRGLGNAPIIRETPGARYAIYCNEEAYIESFVDRFGFKNQAGAVINIGVMAEGIVGIAREEGRDLDESFSRLATIADFFDIAGRKVTVSRSPISQAMLRKDKYFLFEAICNNPKAFESLFNRRFIQIAAKFRYIAKYSCRLLLFTMFELPDLAQQVTEQTKRRSEICEEEGEVKLYKDVKVPEKRMRQMRYEIISGLREVSRRLSARADYQRMPPEEQAELLFQEQGVFLRKYSHLGLVRLACIYLREFIDLSLVNKPNFEKEMFEAAQRNMGLISDEMSNLSNALLENAYRIAKKRAEVSFGKPLKEFVCPESLEAAMPELDAANKVLGRQDDHLVRNGIRPIYKESKACFARIHELLLANKDDFSKVNLSEEGTKRDDINSGLCDRIWASLSAQEQSSLNEAFANSKTTAAVGLANYLFGIFRYMRTSRLALLLGGANARREFPSFDYDCFFIYEAGGETTKGSTNQQYFEFLFDLLEKTITAMDHNFDCNFTPFRNKALTLQELFQYFEKGGLESYLHARAYSVLTFGAGDRSFADFAERRIYSFVYHPNTASILSYARYAEYRQTKTANLDFLTEPIFEVPKTNIKFHSGGLRDVAYLYWIFKLQNNSQESNVSRILDQIAAKHGSEAAQLVDKLKESYEFIMNVRIRLDLFMGRNNKNLPEKDELERFAVSLGYHDGVSPNPAGNFTRDLEMHRARITRHVKKLIKIVIDLRTAEEHVRRSFGSTDAIGRAL
jgi:hypothetical protein